jgi:hypothetical protein
VEEHGVTLTRTYVEYAVRDAQATWECFRELAARYEQLGLSETPLPMAYSEASIGKANLRAIGVKPWRVMQPDFPKPMLGNIMGGYFGGRSEVGIRREVRQIVLCDFLSMYPTVCTLMGLWRFVIADGMTWCDRTAEAEEFLQNIKLSDDLLDPATWPKMAMLVRVKPGADIFPVRAKYEAEGQTTIGLNYLTSERPLWFTMADCVASKLLTGRAPAVVEAVGFEPREAQADLQSISIAGNAAYRIDPYHDDLYKRVIEMRQLVKVDRDAAGGSEYERLDTEQNALKIVANATSYGILVEINVNDLAEKNATRVHTSVDIPYEIGTKKVEEPGRYFHPLLASLITGGARLMLAMTENLIADNGLEWSFCDTDSMAIARPEEMPVNDFYCRVDMIVGAFTALNPYEFGGSILKIEDVNFSIADKTIREPLFCWAISAKRYALFNVASDGAPIIRKASAHGLGHLKAPYDKLNPAVDIPKPAAKLEKIGVELWQHDHWWQILAAALAGQPDTVDLAYHPALTMPAVSRYAATSPRLLDWFKSFNRDRPYEQQVKPFGFLYSLFANPLAGRARMSDTVIDGRNSLGGRAKRPPKPAAPFEKDLAKAVAAAFDRNTGAPVQPELLKSYRQVLAQYHLHPESKFLNADFLDTGLTVRRHVHVSSVRNIGKEADHWEEQIYLGVDEQMEVDHGLSSEEEVHSLATLRDLAAGQGQRKLARKLGIARGTLAKRLGRAK